MSKCELCGEPMPEGEEMFKFHGYSGNCPKPPMTDETTNCPNERLVMRVTHGEINELKVMAEILEEAAGNLRGLMDTKEADALQVREWLPDELEGSALLLRDMANGAESA